MATAANGVSSPIENVGSLASLAIGTNTTEISSLLQPKATWCTKISSGVGSVAIARPDEMEMSPSRTQSP
ncbi:unannotated protein [freshwater metagenome]|uniref:Unannotated protein n=1 Tax=freshwater metagenome TaxID=449393 RepID=A0A6J6RVA4_9ZZZZ